MLKPKSGKAPSANTAETITIALGTEGGHLSFSRATQSRYRIGKPAGDLPAPGRYALRSVVLRPGRQRAEIESRDGSVVELRHDGPSAARDGAPYVPLQTAAFLVLATLPNGGVGCRVDVLGPEHAGADAIVDAILEGPSEPRSSDDLPAPVPERESAFRRFTSVAAAWRPNPPASSPAPSLVRDAGAEFVPGTRQADMPEGAAPRKRLSSSVSGLFVRKGRPAPTAAQPAGRTGRIGGLFAKKAASPGLPHHAASGDEGVPAMIEPAGTMADEPIADAVEGGSRADAWAKYADACAAHEDKRAAIRTEVLREIEARSGEDYLVSASGRKELDRVTEDRFREVMRDVFGIVPPAAP